jgi:hypothetical protein
MERPAGFPYLDHDDGPLHLPASSAQAAVARLFPPRKSIRPPETFRPAGSYMANLDGSFPMIHKGIEYTLAMTATPGIWQWQFRIGDSFKTGKTETMIQLLAIRRVQQRIDRELKDVARAQTQ